MAKHILPRDWVDPQVTGRNRVMMHTPLGAWPDAQTARSGQSSPFRLLLNGVWKFKLTRSPEQMPPGFTDPALDDSGWHPMVVASNWQLDPTVDDQPIYTNSHYPFEVNVPYPPAVNPTGWYRTSFELPASWAGRQVFLWMESCDSACKLWVNGVEIGYGQDSKLPQEFDLTPVLQPGRNHLAVMVPRYCDGSYLEDQDYWLLSGIARDVVLYSKPSAYLRDYIVRTHWDTDYNDARLEIIAYMNPVADLAGGYRVQAMLYDPQDQPVFAEALTAEVAPVSPMYGHTRSLHTAAQFSIPIVAPEKWTAETPTLYTLVLTLIHPSGQAVDFERCRVGFRQVEIRDRQLLLNGRRLIVRGVNAHEHHPLRGHARTLEDMRQDILAMKRLNFNAVRTCHYPKPSAFYDLCDELGMMVIDEANLETHGVQAMLSCEPVWMQAYMERAQRMVLRDKNHPCIIGWSLGNESYHGPHHAAMAAWIRHYDPTRPVQYESGLPDSTISDILCPMYPKLDWVRSILGDHREKRPMILCEYAYAKGNAGGNFKEFWDLVDSLPSFQGGFIWDWSEKALVKEVDGQPQWAYGNEFDGGIGPDGFDYGKREAPTQVLNGVVMPDLTPKPAGWEIMQVQSPVQAMVGDKQNITLGQFTLWNQYHARDLSHLELQWQLTEDGKVIRCGRGPMPKAQPGEKVPVDLALEPIQAIAGAEYFLHVDFVLAADQPWAKAGHVIGWNQFALPVETPKPPMLLLDQMAAMELRDQNETIEVIGKGFSLRFSKEQGGLDEWVWDDLLLIHQGPRDLFYRAPTDNDRKLDHPDSYHRDWLRWGLDRLERRVQYCVASKLSESVVLIRVVAELLAPDAEVKVPPIQCVTQYMIHGSGDLVVQNQVVIDVPIRHVPRIGTELLLAGAFNRLAWFGRGPHESYADRKQSARVGWYQGMVAEQFFPFIVPSECGGKEDVRWLTLTNHAGTGLMIAGMPRLHVNAQHYRIADLAKARHNYDLTPTQDVVLHLDHRHMGLGGDTGWTLNVHEPYMIRPGTYHYSYRLRGLKPGDDARLLARTGIQGIHSGGNAVP